jgi:hypothetical protein
MDFKIVEFSLFIYVLIIRIINSSSKLRQQKAEVNFILPGNYAVQYALVDSAGGWIII